MEHIEYSCLKPKGLEPIFGMKHRLVDFYLVCLNYGTGPKMAPPWGHTFYYIPLYREHIKTYSCQI